MRKCEDGKMSRKRYNQGMRRKTKTSKIRRNMRKWGYKKKNEQMRKLNKI